MSITVLNEILHGTGWCCIKVIAANKVGSKVVFSLPGTWMSVGECTIAAIGEARHLDREACSWGRVMGVVVFVFGRDRKRGSVGDIRDSHFSNARNL